MNIGNYLNYVLGSENIDKKNIYDKVKMLMESTEGSYITYSRFCNKINSDTLTAKEFIYIASALGERFDCNKFIQMVILSLPAECNFRFPTVDDEMSKLRDELDLWDDNEILFINDEKFDFYKTIPNVKLLDKQTSTIYSIVKYQDDFSDKTEQEKQEAKEIGVTDVDYLSYSLETNELRWEEVLFGDNFTGSSHSSVPHVLGTPGHGGYRELFYTNKLTDYLKLIDMSYEDFEKIGLADKIKHAREWMVIRNELSGKRLTDYDHLEFDI